LPRLYLQASASYALDSTDTPRLACWAPTISSSTVPTILERHRHGGIRPQRQDGFAGAILLLSANNYIDNSAYSQPYGAGAEEHGVTATINRRIQQGDSRLAEIRLFSETGMKRREVTMITMPTWFSEPPIPLLIS